VTDRERERRSKSRVQCTNIQQLALGIGLYFGNQKKKIIKRLFRKTKLKKIQEKKKKKK